MIYRPFTDFEACETGLWWSATPWEKVSLKYPNKEMGLDTLIAGPLGQNEREFVESYWAVLEGTEGGIGDVFQGFDNRDIVVSERVAEIIKRLEPAKHELVQIPNVWSFGDQKRLGKSLFFLNVFVAARTVDLGRSSVYSGVRKTDGRKFKFLESVSENTSVVFESSMNGRHLWRDDVTLAVFMSAELVSALKSAGAKGFDFQRCTVISE